MICLSAGHRPGAEGASYLDPATNKLITEYELAVAWCYQIKALVGNDVDLVPNGYLKEKVAHINSLSPMMAIEIHFNSATNSEGVNIGSGFETLYYPGSESGKRLAEELQAELSKVSGIGNNRGAKEGYYRLQERFGPDFFLAKTKCPALIVEPAFIHEVDRIKDIEFMALSGIARYIKQHI